MNEASASSWIRVFEWKTSWSVESQPVDEEDDPYKTLKDYHYLKQLWCYLNKLKQISNKA